MKTKSLETGFNDIFGQPLFVGDKVVFNPPKYKGLAHGEIVGYGEKMVTIAFGEERTYGNKNYGRDTKSDYPENVVKDMRDEQDAVQASD